MSQEILKNSRPIEQTVILHHKRNLRKTMLYNSKQDFEKEQEQMVPKNKLIDKSIKKNNKDENIIFTGKRSLKFDNFLIKKDEQNEKQNNNNSKTINPFKDVLISKNEEKGDDKKQINNNPNIRNPFKINNERQEIFNNPFKIPEKDKINKSNPFIKLFDRNNNNINNNGLENKTTINPFKNIGNNSDQNNPFLIKDNNKNEFNPFKNINNNNDNKLLTNPFITNNHNTNNGKTNNPFINSSSNPFTFNAFNIKNNSPLKEAQKEQSDNEGDNDNNVEEEIQIEKDENKLKNLKEVQYTQTDKFFETEIENLQFLERENGKNKYVTKGNGIFSLQEEIDENGKKVGIFILRESSTKNIKLQGIILDSTTVEKSKLKNGLEFIFIKNILVKYAKYNADKLTEETKITFLRIRININEIDNFYNKFVEFFNLIKN